MNLLRSLLSIFIFFIFFSGTKSSSNSYDPAHLFSVQELQEDFQYYRTKIEKRYPSLYLYSSKEKIDHYFDSIYSGIDRQMTEREFYRHISTVVSVIKDGHDFIYGGKGYGDYMLKHGIYLPLHVQWINEKLLVDMNCMPDSVIPVGAEIISINEVPASTIVNEMLIRLPRDGENRTMPLYLLNTYFTGFYSSVYGNQKEFRLRYRNLNNMELEQTVEALSYDSIKSNRLRKYPERNAKLVEPTAISLELNLNTSTALLTIPSFDKNEIKNKYHQNYKNTIDKMMERINSNGIKNLVIDVRGNGGGNPTFSRYLLCYLMNKPFRYANQCQSVRRGRLNRNPLKNTRRYYPGCGLGNFHPFKNSFKGAIYVLTNGGSFSATGEFSSCLYRYKRAVFIGEETGGNKTIEGGQYFSVKYTMPHTKIIFVPCTELTILQATDLNDGHGVFPGFEIVPSFDDIISDKDTVLDFAYQLIQKNAASAN